MTNTAVTLPDPPRVSAWRTTGTIKVRLVPYDPRYTRGTEPDTRGTK